MKTSSSFLHLCGQPSLIFQTSHLVSLVLWGKKQGASCHTSPGYHTASQLVAINKQRSSERWGVMDIY